MDKLEKYYKNKFEDFEQEALPDAFDRIQQSLDSGIPSSNFTNDTLSKNTWFKSTSSLVKISISMNIILLIALPLAYFWGSSNINNHIQSERVKQNHELIISRDTKRNESKKNVNPITIPSNNNNRSKNQIVTTQSKDQTTVSQDLQTTKADPTQTIAPTVSSSALTQEPIHENKMVEATKKPEPKKEITSNSPTKRKKNIEAYYEDNATKLKDSTSLLFKKK